MVRQNRYWTITFKAPNPNRYFHNKNLIFSIQNIFFFGSSKHLYLRLGKTITFRFEFSVGHFSISFKNNDLCSDWFGWPNLAEPPDIGRLLLYKHYLLNFERKIVLRIPISYLKIRSKSKKKPRIVCIMFQFLSIICTYLKRF